MNELKFMNPARKTVEYMPFAGGENGEGYDIMFRRKCAYRLGGYNSRLLPTGKDDMEGSSSMEPFVRHKEQNGPELNLLQGWMDEFPGLTAGFTGRHGGAGSAPYESLNLGLHVGDDPDTVVENRRRLAEAVGVPLASWTYGEQVHLCRVQTVEAVHSGLGTLSRADAFADTDAFITKEPGMVLAALFADCVPLYFLDPEHRAVGLAHAGWKGTVLQIAAHTVKAMAERFDTRPDRMRAAIGPSIGACCYEVDDRVAGEFIRLLGDKAEAWLSVGSQQGKFMLNLQEINREIMIEAGILPYHIEITMLCTGCHPSRFFSHRKEQGQTGRMAAWMGWK